MASETAKYNEEARRGPVICMTDFARDLACSRTEYEAKYGHPVDVSRNSGEHLTASKRALFEAIRNAGGRW